jgi:hypothetical protein
LFCERFVVELKRAREVAVVAAIAFGKRGATNFRLDPKLLVKPDGMTSLIYVPTFKLKRYLVSLSDESQMS